MTAFRYGRWDGTQKEFSMDVQSALDALSDLMMEGLDAAEALEWMRRCGFDRAGQDMRVAGMDELRDELRKALRSLYDEYSMDEAMSEVDSRLDDILDREERDLRAQHGYESAAMNDFLERRHREASRTTDRIEAMRDYDFSDETQLEASTEWTHNNANDRLDPSGGSSSWIRLRSAIPTRFSETRFLSLEAAHSQYFEPIERVVFATRLGTGWARPWGDVTELAPTNRFFAGGITSMRGFRRGRLGPVDPEGTPVGGEVKLEAGLELRFPIWKAIRGAGFMDMGQIFGDRHQLRWDELEVAVGPSLILMTPIGPIRGDVGFRLTDVVPNQPGEAYHLAIGHPF